MTDEEKKFNKQVEKYLKGKAKAFADRMKFWKKKELVENLPALPYYPERKGENPYELKGSDMARKYPITLYRPKTNAAPVDIVEESGGRLKIKRPSGRMIWLAIFGIIIIGGFFFVTQNALANSLIVGAWNQFKPVLNMQINGVPLTDTWTYLKCVWDNSWVYKLTNPASIDPFEGQISTDLFEYCKQDLIAAEDIGCTECFRIQAEALNLRVQAGKQEAVVSARVWADEDVFCGRGEGTCDRPIAPAVNAKITIVDSNGKEADLEESFKTDQLNPKILKENSLYVIGRFGTENYCASTKRSIDATARLEYSYATTGEGSINVRKTIEKDPLDVFSQSNSIVYPGPVKIDIIPDSHTFGGVYVSEIYDKAFVNIRFRNAGNGKAVIKAVELDQEGPEGENLLVLDSCTGPASAGRSENGRTSMFPDVEIGPSERSSTITCIYELDNAKSSKARTPQYKIIGTVYYDYIIKSEANSIIVDTSQCTEAVTSFTSTDSQSSKDTSSNNQEGSDMSGSGDNSGSGASCTVYPDIDKVCSVGEIQEDGCCR